MAHAKEQFDTTVDVLKELKCDGKDKLVVLNKMDLLTSPAGVESGKAGVSGCRKEYLH